MSADDSTLTVGPLDTLTGQAVLPQVPALTVVWHPHLDRIGQIAPLTGLLERDVVHISRSAPPFVSPGGHAGEPLAHRFISKSPVLEIRAVRGGFELRRLRQDEVEIDGQPLAAVCVVAGPDLARGIILTLARRVTLCLHTVHVPVNRSPSLGLLGTSDAIEDVRRSIARVAPQDSPVLLHGESGSGKELAAHALHREGPRAKGPFVAINMAELDRARAAADLFGHKRGSFTGATTDNPGHFRAASGGTIFLDEIGYTPKDVQPMLLRVIDDRRVQPVGSSEGVTVDARVIAATDAKLEEAVAEGRFERPLYNRLRNAHVINLPPLRSRREDVGVLLLSLIKREVPDLSTLQRVQDPDPKSRPWISARDIAAVARAPLPANVRSLLGLARRLALTVGEGPAADTHAVIQDFLASDLDPSEIDHGRADVPVERGQFEPEKVVAALERARWNRRKAAQILGIGPTTFYRWLDRKPDFRRLLDLDPQTLRSQLDAAGGDVDRVARELKTTPALLRRLLARPA